MKAFVIRLHGVTLPPWVTVDSSSPVAKEVALSKAALRSCNLHTYSVQREELLARSSANVCIISSRICLCLYCPESALSAPITNQSTTHSNTNLILSTISPLPPPPPLSSPSPSSPSNPPPSNPPSSPSWSGGQHHSEIRKSQLEENATNLGGTK